jgi:hypothetical protein
MNFKEWLLAEATLKYMSTYPGWNSLYAVGLLHALPQEKKDILAKGIYDSMQAERRALIGIEFVKMLRHEFTNYEEESDKLMDRDVGCLKLKERCARSHDSFNMVQEIIENLLRPEHIRDAMIANRAWLTAKLQEYSAEEDRLRAIRKPIPSDRDRAEAKRKGIMPRKAGTCRDLFPDMCGLTTNT